jgi:hypothetical protein
MKNTKQTLAVILLVAVLIVGGLSLVSMQKEMAQAAEDNPEPNDHDMPDGVENTNETSALPNGNETAN